MKFLLSVLLIAIHAKDTRNAELRKSNQALLQALKALSLSTEQQLGQEDLPACVCATKWKDPGCIDQDKWNFGCPQDACDGPTEARWCLTANNEPCATEQNLEGWTECDDNTPVFGAEGAAEDEDCKVAVKGSEADCDGCKVTFIDTRREPVCAWGYSEEKCTKINEEDEDVTTKYCEASCGTCDSCYLRGRCVTKFTKKTCEDYDGRVCGTNLQAEPTRPPVGQRNCVDCTCSSWTKATKTYSNCSPGWKSYGYTVKCEDGGKIPMPGLYTKHGDACKAYINGKN